MKNLVVRAVTGVLFVVVMVGGIMYSPVTFAILFALVTGCATWEFCTIVNARGDVRVKRTMCSLSAMYLFAATWFVCLGGTLELLVLYVPYILAILYLTILELYRKSEHAINNWAFTFMSQMYVALPMSLLNVIEFNSVIGYYVLAVFVFLWCSDTGAYCTGSLIGRHKLFPSVSPGKTWEGSIGGGVVAIAVSQLICVYASDVAPALPAFSEVFDEMPYMDNVFWAGMALTVVVFGTWGDLVESLLKRRLGIKDSGNVLPGHGGWLDRFDSSLLAIPAVAVYVMGWMMC